VYDLIRVSIGRDKDRVGMWKKSIEKVPYTTFYISINVMVMVEEKHRIVMTFIALRGVEASKLLEPRVVCHRRSKFGGLEGRRP